MYLSKFLLETLFSHKKAILLIFVSFEIDISALLRVLVKLERKLFHFCFSIFNTSGASLIWGRGEGLPSHLPEPKKFFSPTTENMPLLILCFEQQE